MIVHGPFSLSSIMGKAIAYRNLEPVDPGLPRFAEVARACGLPPAPVPRKTDLPYACALAHLSRAAARLYGRPEPRALLLLGDTRMNDGSCFQNLQRATGWQGLAFICSENLAEPASLQEPEPGILIGNRWAQLGQLPRILQERGIGADERLLVIVDLDKTAIGARGRNDRLIDEARIEGVRVTAAELLGDAYDESAFLLAYHALNKPPFHPFTADNQDYLVFICLTIAAGLYALPEVMSGAKDGRWPSFAAFMKDVRAREAEIARLPLWAAYRPFVERFEQGDPTPFKAFRRNEFRATIKRMGCLQTPQSAEEALQGEIVITHEVVQFIEFLQERGALILGISDKPDEAALPGPEDAALGLLGLHEAATHCVGESIF
jgi:hypothetical protein